MDKKNNFSQRLITVTKQATSSGRMSQLRVYFYMKQISAEFFSQKCEYQRYIQNPTSLMELFFAKIVNSFQSLTIFASKLHHRCSTRF